MTFLPDDVGIVRRVCSQSSINKQLVQVAQRRHGDPRFGEHHDGTRDGVEHPCRHHFDYARLGFNMDDTAGTALLNIANLCAPAVQWMPAIVNFNFLPDMGRMTANLRSGARTGCLWGPSVPDGVPPTSWGCWPPPRQMGWTRMLGSPTCLRVCPPRLTAISTCFCRFPHTGNPRRSADHDCSVVSM